MGGRVPAAGRAQRRRRRLAVLAAACTAAGLTALVWWYSRGPRGGMAASAPPPASPSRPPAEQSFPPIDVIRIEPTAAGLERGDPLLGAISSDYRHVVVLEVNALVHSPLGRLWLDCLDRGRAEALDKLRRSGIEPLVDVHRFAFAWGDGNGQALAAASGHFGRVGPTELAWLPSEDPRDEPGIVRAYGSDALAVEDKLCFIECVPITWVLWRNRTLLVSYPELARASVDLLRGRSEGGTLAMPEGLGAAEVSGVVSARDVASWLELDGPALREWLSQLRTRAEVRIDAMRDVRAEARVTVEDPAAAGDLAALFAAAMAAERAAAREKGDWKRAELLERVTVSRGEGSFTLRLDLPLDALERQFAGCRDRGDD